MSNLPIYDIHNIQLYCMYHCEMTVLRSVTFMNFEMIYIHTYILYTVHNKVHIFCFITIYENIQNTLFSIIQHYKTAALTQIII